MFVVYYASFFVFIIVSWDLIFFAVNQGISLVNLNMSTHH